jgi:glutamate-1-semialdehyde 2,1-aminomutase
VIGGGFPVAAYGGRRDLIELVAPVGPVYQAGTLSANPVGMRAGLATLRKLEQVQAYSLLAQRTTAFCDRLNNQFAELCLPFEVTHTASIFWLHASAHGPIRRIEQIPANNAPAFARLFHAALDGGVYLAPSGYEVNFMSLAHTDELLDDAAKVIVQAVKTTETK